VGLELCDWVIFVFLMGIYRLVMCCRVVGICGFVRSWGRMGWDLWVERGGCWNLNVSGLILVVVSGEYQMGHLEVLEKIVKM
jgi:hypothetical protein